ncbi:mRNA decapping enzyme [Auriculariales sp. MPI-PUGE-AT-0066]|nr:mRNA decapping enzyme [Auriculariales sp. MPI-PUGE-AT-0066]
MIDITFLKSFQLTEVINDDATSHSITLLGTLPAADGARESAIVIIQKTAFDANNLDLPAVLNTVQLLEHNDIYAWLVATLTPHESHPDVKINLIFPATATHIAKYSRQKLLVVRETPALFERIVRPYINAFPASRTEWVRNILSHEKEAHKILYEDPSDESGFLIMPDMKWDLRTSSALYLMALIRNPSIACLRDLRASHIPLLQNVRREAKRVAKERWDIPENGLRMFIHYQPSYYHFHIHIVNANFTGLAGQSVGQAHLLDDVISLLSLDSDIFAKMTLGYSLGERHALAAPMLAAQADIT